MDGDGEDLLRPLLADDVVVRDFFDLAGLGDLGEAGGGLFAVDLLGDDVVAEGDALIADIDRGPGDELLYFTLRLSTEGAGEVPRFTTSCHLDSYLGRFAPYYEILRPGRVSCQ